LIADIPFKIDLSSQRPGRYRLSWPSVEGHYYEVWAGTNVASLVLVTNLPGRFPETEWTTPIAGFPQRFFRIRAFWP
jgi:hypothetical protein